jgi:hypothetical protein
LAPFGAALPLPASEQRSSTTDFGDAEDTGSEDPVTRVAPGDDEVHAASQPVLRTTGIMATARRPRQCMR